MRQHGDAQPTAQQAFVEDHVVEAGRQIADPADARAFDILDRFQGANGDGETRQKFVRLHVPVEPLEGDVLVFEVALEDGGEMAHGNDRVQLDLAFLFRIGRGPQAQPRRRLDQGQQLLAHAAGGCLQEQEVDLLGAEILGGLGRRFFGHHLVADRHQVEVQLSRQFLQTSHRSRALIVFVGEIRRN